MKRISLWGALALAVAIWCGTAVAQRAAVQPDSTKAPASNSAPPNAAEEPLFPVPPMPTGEVSLVGGTVVKVDRVRNRLSVRPFSGKKMSMFFDERTHIYRDGMETTQLGIHPGDRVYVDTMLDGSRVFARNIRVQTHAAPADARGQVLGYDRSTGVMTVRDELSSQDVSFHVTRDTVIKTEQPSAAADLRPGSLVAVQFSPASADRGVAWQISVLASPGNKFTFAGKVVFLDLRDGILGIQNQTDNRIYNLHFTPATPGVSQDLVVGSEVTAPAVFNGTDYVAQQISMNQAKSTLPQQ